jgi:hypothetical protein
MEKNNLAGFKVLEYSPTQRCFHVQTVGEMLKKNIRVFKEGRVTDYVCIGIFHNKEKLQPFLDMAHEVLRESVKRSKLTL